jgi:membrane protease YdiL (CAAX protease family)
MDSTKGSSEDIQDRKLILRFLFWAFALTWVLLFAAFNWSLEVTVRILGHALRIPLATVLSFLANLGPAGAALIALSTKNRLKERRSLLKEISTFRISWKWYVLAIGIPISILGLAIVGLLAITGLPFSWNQGAFGMWVDLLLFGALFKALGEEVGWRGFLLPRLQERMSGFAASILVGMAWWTWHLPDRLYPQQPLRLVVHALFLVQVLSLSVLLAWLRNAARISLVPVTLFHAVFNAAVDTIQIPGDAGIQWRWLFCLTIATLLAAGLVLTIFGKQLGAARSIDTGS